MSADTWTAVAAVSQALTVIVAGWAALYARGQVREARETRERVAQPEVVVFVDHHQVRRYVDLVIKNFGQTTAYNVRITLPPLEVARYVSEATGDEVRHVLMPTKIAVLAPGQEWRTVWDSVVRRENFKGELRDQYGGFVEFDDKIEDSGKRTYRNPIALDIRMFWNTMWIEQNKGQSVEKALYDIADTLAHYGRDGDGLWVYTEAADVERRRRDEHREAQLRVHEQFLRETGAIVDDPENDEREH
ncbi:hypothetical protein [Mycolicibacterium obuense]|uniref:Uncharacterized protein n=1 Tax=Mycolicibacterium obuense TaxID=1807 RepID=A0A0M2K8X7_9MYCO|nr:hypothetical protein [Mycolicibacterium obuense]KKF03411.1 hypothetical protein WN67_03265 [Mycolicibacterium obuense]